MFRCFNELRKLRRAEDFRFRCGGYFPLFSNFSPISPFGCCVVSGSPSLFRKGVSVVYGFWGTPDRRSADGNSLSAGRTPALPPRTSQIGQSWRDELRRVSMAGRPESQTVQRQLEELPNHRHGRLNSPRLLNFAPIRASNSSSTASSIDTLPV
jgi:hypothetical protein